MEVSKNQWRSVHEMVTALAVGCLQADQWFPGWKPPVDLANVLNDLAERLAPLADERGAFQVESSYDLLHEFVHSHPICQGWNRIGSPPDFVFTSRYDAPAKERQFIDLDAIVQNARSFLRREDEQIFGCDLRVAAEHPEWPMSEPEP